MATAIDTVDGNSLKQRANSDVNSNVRFELEKLNAATDGINHLETEFEEANALMQKMVNEALDLLGQCTKKIGKSSIDKAGSYFDLCEKLEKAQDDLQEAEIWYEEVKRNVTDAKEKITQVEKRAFSSENKILDPNIQEEINQANIEFGKAVNRRNEYEQRYKDCKQACKSLENQIESVKKKFEKHIKKARSYFELKKTLYKGLEQQRERVEKIGEGICFAKEQYSEVLGNLENISEEIHRRRRNRDKSSSLTKDGEPNENFRKSMNEASLNETEQKKLTEYMTNCQDKSEKEDNDDNNE